MVRISSPPNPRFPHFFTRPLPLSHRLGAPTLPAVGSLQHLPHATQHTSGLGLSPSYQHCSGRRRSRLVFFHDPPRSTTCRCRVAAPSRDCTALPRAHVSMVSSGRLCTILLSIVNNLHEQAVVNYFEGTFPNVIW